MVEVENIDVEPISPSIGACQWSQVERESEGIIRALTVKDGGRMVDDAYEHFTREKDQSLRWVFANALRTAMPYRDRRKHPEIAEAYRLGGSKKGD